MKCFMYHNYIYYFLHKILEIYTYNTQVITYLLIYFQFKI